MLAFAPPQPLMLLATALAALLCLEAARRARWNAPVSEHLHWALATAFVLLGHRMRIELEYGVTLHYLGSAFLALLLGYPRALLSMALVVLAQCLWPEAGVIDPARLADWGVRTLLAGVLPIWTMWLIVSAALRWLPRNPFVFLLGCGLFGLFASYAVQIVVTLLAWRWFGDAVPDSVVDNLLPYALLLASGEAWLEGMLVTLLVVYLPGSVRLFNEGFYLARR